MSDAEPDAAPMPSAPSRDELARVAAEEAAKIAPPLTIEERARRLEVEKREDATRRSVACAKEIEATCARYGCVLKVERAASVDEDGIVRFHARPVVAAKPTAS